MDGRLPEGIARALDRGETVVTANQRAARSLRHAVDRRNRARGMSGWQPPSIAAWQTWTATIWRKLLLEGRVEEVLLNHTQEHEIWRDVLSSDHELSRGSLRSLDSLAAMASDAWSKLCSHHGRTQLRWVSNSTDTRSFQRWAQAFEARCHNERLLPLAQIEERLREIARSGLLSTGNIALAGFDSLTPAQASLVEAIRQSSSVDELYETRPIESRSVTTAPDELEELHLAARWARSVLEKNPQSRIAVIVPDLEKDRAAIDRAFRQILAPELEDIAASNEGPYEFSLGPSLNRTPMVAVALELLQWIDGELELDRLSALLVSPYFAMVDAERGARAEFDAFELRRVKLLVPSITVGSFAKMVDSSRRRKRLHHLRETLRLMDSLIKGRLRKEERRYYADWAETMADFLKAARWGRADEDSIEFQTMRKWQSALDELSSLDLNGRRVTFRDALARLTWITKETMFAAESREAPVQIMGPLEAAGSTFDALWFLRAGDLTWPRRAGHNPLLPWHLQRQLGIPGTSADRDDEHTRRITTRIMESASLTVFSYALETASGHQKQSPILETLGLEPVDPAKLAPMHSDAAAVTLEEIDDCPPAPVQTDRVIQGGSRILELQAACGFRAFAEKRLWSTELEDLVLGMDARERGNLVHNALKYLWDELKTQDNLIRMSPAELGNVVERTVSAALTESSTIASTPWEIAYIEMQRTRLSRLLHQWLNIERSRAPFTVRLSEKDYDDVRIGPLRISIRVDRVDVTEDGGEILIDYKTGHADPKEWLTDRPAAPQLPLYAAVSDAKRIAGVAFGIVHSGKTMSLKGYATDSSLLTKLVSKKEASTLEEQVERWRRVLSDLATDFYRGDARVDPREYPTTCKYCAQRLFCRLDPSSLEDDLDEDLQAEDSNG